MTNFRNISAKKDKKNFLLSSSDFEALKLLFVSRSYPEIFFKLQVTITSDLL